MTDHARPSGLVDALAEYEFGLQDRSERHYRDAEEAEQEHYRKLARQLLGHLRDEGYIVVPQSASAETLRDLHRAVLAVCEARP